MLTMYPVPGKEKSRLICAAFAAGAPKSARGSVFFGTEGVMAPFQRAKRSDDPWWYIDNSYFDKHRGIYFRVTKSALQVDPAGKTSDGKRFAALQVPVKPMFTDERHEIVIAPQSDDFMKSTLGLGFDWLRNVTQWLDTHPELRASIRVHPWQRDKLKRNTTFAERLPRTRLVISYSSAASITALLEGVPAISMGDSAAAYAIGGPLTHANVTNPVRPSVEERTAFAEILADNQFTLDEFRSGKAWAWLER